MAEDIIYPAAICRLRTVRHQLACGNRYRDVAALKTVQMYSDRISRYSSRVLLLQRGGKSSRKVPLRLDISE